MSGRLIETKTLRGELPTTRWSIVRAMGGGPTERRQALEVFARDYWQAVYAFARKKGHGPQEAEDLTQRFLSELIERDPFTSLAREKGRFRSWLLASLHNFLRSDWRDKQRIKRGGGVLHVSIDRDLGESWLEMAGAEELSPDVAFDRRWAAGILQRSMEALTRMYEREGKLELARALAPLIAGTHERRGYTEVAAQLGIDESHARVAAFRMRKRLRHLVREEVAATVASPGEVDEELRELFALFGAGNPAQVR